MKRRHSSAVGVSLLIAAMLIPAPVAARSAADRPNGGIGHPRANLATADLSKLPSMSQSTRRRDLFIQLSGRPVTSYQAAQLASAGTRMSEASKATVRANLAQQQAQVSSRIRASGARIVSAFTDTLNGFHVLATDAQARNIARLSSVTKVYVIPEAKRTDIQSADYIKAIAAWTDNGLTGKGVTIAIIDSGINYYHKNFGGSGNPAFQNDNPNKVEPGTFPTAKVVGGYDFVGDNYDPEGTPDQQVPNPDKDPLDCKSKTSGNVQHGDHVAGIAAGEGVLNNGDTYTGPYTASAVNSTNFRIGPGIAPDAKLVAYRVLSCDGGTYLTPDALERATRDGVDVVNMSLGSDLGTPDSIDSIAANAAAQSGVVIVASAGNAGPGAYMAGSPANATRIISVGAVDAAEFVADGVIADFPGSATDVGGFNMYGSDLPVSGTHRVIMDGDSLSLGCSPDDFADVQKGDIVTIARGDCAFSDKRGNAQAAGAAGVILVNNEDATLINPVPDPDHTIPMVSTRPGNAEALVENDGLSVTLHSGDVPNEEFGQMAEFSSAGPARYSDMIKPDVSAPGVQVMSTDGASANKGKLLGGTSMASPQVAGTAALVLQAHPGWTTAHVKGAIVGSADPSLVDPFTVRRVGSGIVNARRAATTNSWAESNDDAGNSSLAFGYGAIKVNRSGGAAWQETRSFRLSNSSGSSITYDLSNVWSTDDYGIDVSFPSTVTVPAGESRDVDITLTFSNADANGLPLQAPGDFPDLVFDGPRIYAPLNHIAGEIVANPETGGAGNYNVRVPWLVVPRGTSQMRSEQRQPYTGNALKQSTVRVKNRGVQQGNVDVFAWGLSDQNENQGSIDLRAGGVQSLPTEVCSGVPDPSDRCLIFAINTWYPWQSGADNEYDVDIDVNNDGTADYAVVGIDYQVVFGPGSIQGVPISLIINLNTGDIVDLWFATAAPNSSTYLLPVLASEIGRTSKHQYFRYWVESYPVYDGSSDPGNPVFNFDVMLTGADDVNTSQTARFGAFKNAISSGDFWTLDPGQAADVAISVKSHKYRPQDKGQKGWMFVNIEGPDGQGQADLISVGNIAH